MKTSDLTGAALDWAVAKCEGKENTWGRSKLKPYEYYCGHAYSTDWALGGPIIEREKIGLHFSSVTGLWSAYPFNTSQKYAMSGTTPLIAAMRCYVASKLGEEVEIPDDLK
jgi:hypothetical protein